MNWNAVIKSLQEEINACAKRIQTNTNPYFNSHHETLKMDLYTTLAKALAEGMKEEARDKTFDDHPLEYN